MKGLAMKVLMLCVTCTMLAAPASAEQTWQLPTAQERALADAASWTTMLAAIGLDTAQSWRSDDPRHAFVREGERLAITNVAALVIKHLVHRERPCAPAACGLDEPDTSFFSGHTANAFSTIGTGVSLTLPLAVGTGGLRVAAGKHWPTDVLAGALIGGLTSRLR